MNSIALFPSIQISNSELHISPAYQNNEDNQRHGTLKPTAMCKEIRTICRSCPRITHWAFDSCHNHMDCGERGIDVVVISQESCQRCEEERKGNETPSVFLPDWMEDFKERRVVMREVELLHLLARVGQWDSEAEVPFASLALESVRSLSCKQEWKYKHAVVL